MFITSWISRETMIPPRGAYPEVTALANDWMSGWTPQWVRANHWPVRQKPVMTSSPMKRTSCFVQISRTRGK